jgi:hypothetical protein
MNIKDTLEKVGDSIGTQARGAATDLIEKVSSESREVGERIGDRIVARITDLSDAALKRMGLMTKRRSRRGTLFGVLVGVALGAIAVRILGRDTAGAES